jgi:MFS family permease
MLLHQSDRLLIGPLTTPIMETFGISESRMGLVTTGALLVGTILYPLWGYLYDRYARSKLLALASAIWGSTTWLNAVVRTYPAFLVTRSATGIDDSSYPGIFSLISDYFNPSLRGKVYGILQLTQPLGYMVGLIVATVLSGVMGWRGVFYITGSLGLILAVVIFFGVKEPPRGQSEPEMEGMEQVGSYHFDRKAVVSLFKKPSMIFLVAQGFVGEIPWTVIAFWFFRYLEIERGYSPNEVLVTMMPAILVLSAGYFVGGTIGDAFFKRNPRGRVLTSLVGVIVGAILLAITLNIPNENQTLFLVFLLLTALFIPFASPNVISTVYDISLPEVRSSALAVMYFLSQIGAALAPWLAGSISEAYNLETAFLLICTSTWLLGTLFLGFTAWFVPKDIASLRGQMRQRAEELERGAQGA